MKFDVQNKSLEKDQEKRIDVIFDKDYGFPEIISILGKRSNGWEYLKIKKFEIVK